jgi:hypothetical protein
MKLIMATVSAVVYEDQKKADGTYNVKIRVCHRKKRRILDTGNTNILDPSSPI